MEEVIQLYFLFKKVTNKVKSIFKKHSSGISSNGQPILYIGLWGQGVAGKSMMLGQVPHSDKGILEFHRKDQAGA